LIIICHELKALDVSNKATVVAINTWRNPDWQSESQEFPNYLPNEHSKTLDKTENLST